MNCPNCGLGFAIKSTQLGYFCSFCEFDWPFEQEIENGSS